MNIAATTPAPTTKELRDLKKACEQFEAVFAKQLMTEMRKGTKEASIGDQAGSEIYKDMMDQTIGDAIAHQGSLGIGQMLYKQFAAQVSAGAFPPVGGTQIDGAMSRAGQGADKAARSKGRL